MMKRRFSTLLVCLSLPFSAAGASEVFTPAGYSDFRSPGAIIVDRPMDVVRDQLSIFPELFGEGKPAIELISFMDESNRLVIDFKETGLLDDSVEAINQRFVLEENGDGKFKLWGYGFRQKCYRAPSVGQWIAEPCL